MEQVVDTCGAPADLASLCGQHPSLTPDPPSSVVPELQDPAFGSSDPNFSMITFPYSHDPAISVLEPSHNMSARSPFLWNDLTFLDELNQTFGPLNPSTDIHAQLDLLLTNVRGTPAILDEPAQVIDHHLDVHRINQELLHTPALQEITLYEAHGGPPLPHRLKKRLNESSWSIYVTQLKSASKVIAIRTSLISESSGILSSSARECSQ